MIHNVFGEFQDQCKAALLGSLNRLGLGESLPSIIVKETVSPLFGELTSPICFDLARSLKKPPARIAQEVIAGIDYSRQMLIRSVEEAGGGYVNFRLNYELAAAEVFAAIESLKNEFGYLKTEAPQRIVVEHTSVNPVHPIHIGQARNSILGDALARILRNRGHLVKRHYYIDDMGRQSAIVAYGYQRLGGPPPKEKPDQYLGKIYSITTCLVEVQTLKRKIAELSSAETGEEDLGRVRRDLDEWVSIAAELSAKHPDLFNLLSEAISKDESADLKVAEINRQYEKNEPEAARLVRRVSELCLSGFRETLSRLEIGFDSWDWESDLVWSGHVDRLLKRLMDTSYVQSEAGVFKLDSAKVVEDLDLRGKIGVSETYTLPPLTLARSDGTTLYTTRDIAYTLSKFKDAERVINVIGAEQRLAQLQLKTALHALREGRHASNLTHYVFGLVDMPGYKMSSRRGRFVALDNVLDEAIRRSYREVEGREGSLTLEEKRAIAEKIGIAAVKYVLLSVEPIKTVTFAWDRVLNLESNSAPFINYAFTRTCGILRKLPEQEVTPNLKLLTHPLEKEILCMIIKFPEIFRKAADQLTPDGLINYANSLAEKFHEYYEKVSIIRTEDPAQRAARRLLINAIRVTTENCMRTLGITLTERM